MTAVLGTFLLSALLCGVYLRLPRAWQIIDTPNERSSHLQPTPHGGGVALLTAFSVGLSLVIPVSGRWDQPFTTLVSAAFVLALLGIIDDLRGLSVRLRLWLYGAVCLWAAAMLLQHVESLDLVRGGALVLIAALTMLWSLNLYNFMDGIDGIAALQTVLACSAAAVLSWASVGDTSYALFCLLLAAAHGGFLVWNFPPARLFMGDAGSVATGFILAGLAVVGAIHGQLNPLCWLVLMAAFVTDASWTLLWRIATREPFTQAHRQHMYQRLSRRWHSHAKVDLLLLAINLLWLFPLAFALQNWPEHSLFLVFLAYLPLVGGMAKLRGLP
jgi:Fuc2NAc and GlcNAc transferase